MKITPLERIVLIGWGSAVLYIYAAFRGLTHPDGTLGKVLEVFFLQLTAAYLQ